MNEFWQYRYMYALLPPETPKYLVSFYCERFTEEDIQAMESLGVKREEVEHLNDLMGFKKEPR